MEKNCSRSCIKFYSGSEDTKIQKLQKIIVHGGGRRRVVGEERPLIECFARLVLSLSHCARVPAGWVHSYRCRAFVLLSLSITWQPRGAARHHRDVIPPKTCRITVSLLPVLFCCCFLFIYLFFNYYYFFNVQLEEMDRTKNKKSMRCLFFFF